VELDEGKVMALKAAGEKTEKGAAEERPAVAAGGRGAPLAVSKPAAVN
jgi:hypothetical protein